MVVIPVFMADRLRGPRRERERSQRATRLLDGKQHRDEQSQNHAQPEQALHPTDTSKRFDRGQHRFDHDRWSIKLSTAAARSARLARKLTEA